MMYYHNPKCSKSREGLKILNEKGISPKVKLYLKETLTKSEIESLLEILVDPIASILRENPNNIKLNKNNDELIQHILNNPIALQRPILVNKNKAKIGRPTESLFSII